MTQKNLALRLKILIVAVGAAILLCTTFVLPLSAVPAKWNAARIYATLFWWIAALPCGAALVFSRRIAKNIGCDHSFSAENAVLLKRISTLASIDAGYLLFGSLLRRLFCADPISALLVAVIIASLGIVLSAAFAALSHLVAKAAALQEENDLTI